MLAVVVAASCSLHGGVARPTLQGPQAQVVAVAEAITETELQLRTIAGLAVVAVRFRCTLSTRVETAVVGS